MMIASLDTVSLPTHDQRSNLHRTYNIRIHASMGDSSSDPAKTLEASPYNKETRPP